MRRVTVSSVLVAVVGLVALIGAAGGGVGGLILLGLVVTWWRRAGDRERTRS